MIPLAAKSIALSEGTGFKLKAPIIQRVTPVSMTSTFQIWTWIPATNSNRPQGTEARGR